MKDTKGHGSNSRGGSYQNIDRSGFRKGEHVGYGDGTFRITNLGAGYLATEQRTGESFRGDSLGHVSSQLTDRAAAAELRRGNPKATAAPVHPGASGRSDVEDRMASHGANVINAISGMGRKS